MVKPYYDDGAGLLVYHGDCLDVMRALPDASVDAVVCDPPYALSFMGRDWDGALPGLDVWTEALRVAKPGAHLLAFGGTRTYHRLACAVEDAGFEVRDCLAWMYGSGFPKSLDVSNAIDKAAGAERERTGRVLSVTGNRAAPSSAMVTSGLGAVGVGPQAHEETIPATAAARQWQGWGTALKPAWEPVILARKPLCGTVAANVQRYGTGAINVDGCRIGTTVETWPASRSYGSDERNHSWTTGSKGRKETQATPAAPPGRWPANLALDEAAAALLDEQAPDAGGGFVAPYERSSQDYYSGAWPKHNRGGGHDLGGGASRFFYTAKADAAERHVPGLRNVHPTVKPIDLMRWLVRLVTPPGGVVLDPFLGSGTTAIACAQEGLRCIGIEREAEYAQIAVARIKHHGGQRVMGEVVA